jgi:hypothetical protein
MHNFVSQVAKSFLGILTAFGLTGCDVREKDAVSYQKWLERIPVDSKDYELSASFVCSDEFTDCVHYVVFEDGHLVSDQVV